MKNRKALMPYSVEEQAKRAQQRQEQVDKVNKLVAKGMSVIDALKQANVAKSIYYYDSTKKAAKLRKPKKPKITITEIPMLSPKAPTSFLIFGAPKALAEFARAYE